MIQLDHSSKHYRKNRETIRALDDVSLHVPKGALALVRGPSGSGKTTLINLLAGLTRPTSGTVEVAGQPLHTMKPRELDALRAQRIALVFQMFHLIPYLSAFENVLLPTLAVANDDAPERARAMLEQLGIAERASHYPSELSAGERQRCALARALLNRPDLILADEPTGNLDEESAAAVMRMLGACRDEGATVLLVSHQHVDQVQPDVVFSLAAGKLLETSG